MKRVILLKNKAEDSDIYQVHFEQNGWQPIFVPLLKHTHVPNDILSIIRDQQQFPKVKHLVVSSQRAVQCLVEEVIPVISESEKTQLLNKTVYTVGPATQDFLVKSGFKDVRGGKETGNGSLLAEFIIDELSPGCPAAFQDPILLLVGEIRKDIIPKRLTEAGFKVSEIVTYKTEELGGNLRRFQELFQEDDWVVFFSPQGTSEIVEILKGLKAKVASIGPTTKQYLVKAGLPPHVVSHKPEPKSLCDAITNF
ncbi:HBL333Cp [Eremothecium sinecaudum]|uniref:HBL333Cp n=1 Tax=Eremothecium sinecaudum TaxID=45286 RepID=A0A120K0P7_9SACH|nr:HBL333Cp [Eremothecium sinecaudum]AMD18569.1 HBL333Cp [Eremothecium sinecaudum]